MAFIHCLPVSAEVALSILSSTTKTETLENVLKSAIVLNEEKIMVVRPMQPLNDSFRAEKSSSLTQRELLFLLFWGTLPAG